MRDPEAGELGRDDAGGPYLLEGKFGMGMQVTPDFDKTWLNGRRGDAEAAFNVVRTHGRHGFGPFQAFLCGLIPHIAARLRPGKPEAPWPGADWSGFRGRDRAPLRMRRRACDSYSKPLNQARCPWAPR
jgi:hypothetical protein